MAKISARGATKIMQGTSEYRDEEGWDHKVRFALRSDGAVLRAHDLRSPDRREAFGARGWHRGGYSIAAKGWDRERFERAMRAKGYRITTFTI